MRIVKAYDFIKKHFGALSWALSIAAVIISYISYKETNKTNQIAENTLLESRKQFLAVNKPVLMIKQLRLGEGKDYFEIIPDTDTTVKVISAISLENVGPIMAGNVFIHSMTALLSYDANVLARVESKSKPLNDYDNLSDLSIPPGQSVNRTIVSTFNVSDLDRAKLQQKERLTLMLNMLVYCYSDTIQLPNPEAEKVLYATNITNDIMADRYQTNMLIFLDRPTFDMRKPK